MLNKREQNLGAVISSFVIVLLLVYLSFFILGFGGELVMLISMLVIFAGTFCLCFFTIRSLRKQGKHNTIDYLNVGTQRYLLGLFMVFYGIPKLTGNFFDYQLFALDSKLGDVSEFELAWYYFGKNKWQELFAGIMEVVPGLLLLNRRFWYVAALILLPVTGQVFILNLFFKIGGVTFPAACILLACNLYILYSQKEKLLQFFRSIAHSSNAELSRKSRGIVSVGRWTVIVLSLGIVALTVKRSFFAGGSQEGYRQLVGVYELHKVTKNNRPYEPGKDSTLYKDLYIEKQSRWNMLRRCNDKTDAFILKLNPNNDSLELYINKGGIGDSPDIPDSASVLKGTGKLVGNRFLINGLQLGDTLQLEYTRRDIHPKQWFW
ncbi:MAG: hypothetical protein V4677_10320 [Bacteroidota bacterium]